MLMISLIRHGQTYGNSKGKFMGITDEPLLEDERQALAQLTFPMAEAVYCSPMKRCIETAQILFPYENAVIIPEIRERDFGIFEGKTYKDFAEDPEYRSWIEKMEKLSYPGGEDVSSFRDRCIFGLERIIEDAVRKRKSDIAIVAHGGTIMSIMSEYGFPAQKYSEWMVKNGEGYRLRLSPEEFVYGGDIQKRRIIVDGKIIRP